MKIKTTEVCALVFVLMQSCLFGFMINDAFKLTYQNAWIVPITGSILGFIILLLYLYIFNYKKDMNINELNIYLFGNIVGKIINVILLLTIITFTIIIFWVLNNFIISQFLYDTPPFIIEIVFILTIIYVLNHGINSLLRTILIFTYIIFLIHIINTIGLSRQLKITNLMPFNIKLSNLILATINYVAFSILPIFILSILPFNKIEKDKLNKKIIITYIITSITIFIIIFLIISVFGIGLSSLYQFPGYHILKRVFEGGTIERFENILVIFWVLIMFISITIGSYYILKSLKDNFNINKTKYIILFFILYSSNFIFKNSTIAKDWNEYFFPIIMYTGLLIIPILIFFKIKKKDQLLDQTIN